MSFEQTVLSRLQIAPEQPEIVTDVTATLFYSHAAKAGGMPEERADVWGTIADDIAACMSRGFLARPVTTRAEVACDAALSDARDLVVRLHCPGGAHVNVLVVLLRLFAATHQTPASAFTELLIAMDGDRDAAAEMANALNFDRDVARLTIETVGSSAAPFVQMDMRFGRTRGAHVPASGPLGDARVIDAELLHFEGVSAAELDPDLEDALLSLSGTDAFVPLGHNADFTLGDEEWWSPEPGRLTARDISMEQVFLFEAAACLNGGTLATVNAARRTE
mgnify:CR=1 FL=1